MQKSIRKYWPLFVLPTMAAFAIGFIIPFCYGVFLSFCKFTTVTDWKWVGVQNYTKIFYVAGKLDTTFLHSLWYTTLFTVVTMAIINIAAFAIAMALTKGIRGTNFFRTCFFLPNLIGGIVLSYIWLMIFNSVLAKHSLIEAAKIDGANNRQLLTNIILPSLRPTITVCTFLTLTNGFKLFDQNLALTGGNPGKQSELLALNIYNTMYGKTGWQGVGQAKAVIFFILVAVISLIQNKASRSGEVEQ